jgi:hypothetical protein
MWQEGLEVQMTSNGILRHALDKAAEITAKLQPLVLAANSLVTNFNNLTPDQAAVQVGTLTDKLNALLGDFKAGGLIN